MNTASECCLAERLVSLRPMNFKETPMFHICSLKCQTGNAVVGVDTESEQRMRVALRQRSR